MHVGLIIHIKEHYTVEIESHTKNRFDLEQEILGCWNVVSDLQSILDNIANREIPQEELQSLILGLKLLYDIKFNTLFETFENCVRNKNL